MKKNRIHFPTHRPEVQDAQCCAQVGRFSCFPHTRIPGSDLGICDYSTLRACSVQEGQTLARVGRGRGESSLGPSMWVNR